MYVWQLLQVKMIEPRPVVLLGATFWNGFLRWVAGTQAARGFLNFQETFIDDGDVDMLKAMRVYKEVGFDGMMMPDHVPKIQGDATVIRASLSRLVTSRR